MTLYKVIKTTLHSGKAVDIPDIRGEYDNLNSAYRFLATYVNETDRVKYNNPDCKCEFVIVESEE